MARGFAAEHHQVEQRVGAQPVRAVHRDAGRLAHRHQAGHDGVGLARSVDHFAVVIAGNAAHVVVHGGQHGNRIAVHVDAGEDARGLGDARQALVDHLGAQVLQVQVDVIRVLADAAAFADLHGHRAADHVARGQVLGVGRIALHEALARRIGEVTALAARAFGDQAARAVDAGGMELHELHVLQRQAGAQHHAAAITGAGVRGRAGEIGAAITAGGEDGHVRAEAMQLAPVARSSATTPRHSPFSMMRSMAKYSMKNSRLVLQRLLVQRVQHGVAGAIGRRAGALRDALAVVAWSCRRRGAGRCGPRRARERHAVVLQLDDRAGASLHMNSMASWSPSQSEPLTVSYMCQRQSSSPMLASAALMPPCAATVWLRVGNTLVMQAVERPASASPSVARSPAPPAPITMTS